MIEGKETSSTEEKIDHYSRVLTRALQFDQDVKRDMQEGKKRTYIQIEHATGSHSTDLEIGSDLLRIAQGAAFGAYRVLAYDTIYIKETKEEIRVINPVGKEIADGIVEQYAHAVFPEGVTEP